MPSRLINSLATTGPLAEIFSDDSVLGAMLDFEVALAGGEAGLGVIPAAAADAIRKAADVKAFDAAQLSREALRAGTPSIPFVKEFLACVLAVDVPAAGFVHWGATSQDVADTALVLLLKRAHPILKADLERLETALHRLSEQHRDTVMLGRTLLQAAPPVTFGLKAAGWLGAVRRNRLRLESAFDEALVLQFGGASGTLAMLGSQGLAVGSAMARELGIGLPDAPWHTHRDRLAALVTALGVLTGSLGKMATDVSLLMQNEIAEVSEPEAEGRGGSSTMPQKHNPTACTLALASANRVPGLVSSFLSAMVQEHERAAGGWQSEWPIVAEVVQATGLAVASMAEMAKGLLVDRERMQSNIAATRGTVFSERAMMLLGKTLGRQGAHRLLSAAVQKTNAEGRRLSDVLAEIPEVTQVIDENTLRNLDTAEDYLGVAELFRSRLLSSVPDHDPKEKG